MRYYYNNRIISSNDTQTPPPSKVAKLGLWSQKMYNVLKRMKKQFSNFLTFFRFTKFSFAPILFVTITKWVSEDYKKMKKKSIKFVRQYFSGIFFSQNLLEPIQKYFECYDFIEIVVKNVAPILIQYFFLC